jgi:tetratricopeptide (TPR) repeat protein
LCLASLLACACAASPAPAPASAGAPHPAATPDGDRAPDDPVEAVRYFEARAARAPDDLESWQRLAISLRHVNRLQEAARAGWRAVELAPTWESWTALGNILMQGQARAGAFAAFEMAATKAPDPDAAARNFLNLGYRDWAFGNPKGAGMAIDRADKASPNNPQVFYDRAMLLAGTGHAAEGATAAGRALELLAPIPVEKLPTEQARDALKMMRTLLERVAAGHEIPERPPITESGQVLPERFSKANLGHARDLAIDPVSYRIYPAGRGRLLRLEVPSRWNESMQAAQEGTSVRLAADGVPPAAALQVTAIVARDKTIDLRKAAADGADVVRKAGGLVDPIQPIGKAGFWFWSNDPHAKPGSGDDYPFLAQSMSQSSDIVLSATYLTRSASADERAFLPKLIASAGVKKLDE